MAYLILISLKFRPQLSHFIVEETEALRDCTPSKWSSVDSHPGLCDSRSWAVCHNNVGLIIRDSLFACVSSYQLGCGVPKREFFQCSEIPYCLRDSKLGQSWEKVNSWFWLGAVCSLGTCWHSLAAQCTRSQCFTFLSLNRIWAEVH